MAESLRGRHGIGPTSACAILRRRTSRNGIRRAALQRTHSLNSFFPSVAGAGLGAACAPGISTTWISRSENEAASILKDNAGAASTCPLRLSRSFGADNSTPSASATYGKGSSLCARKKRRAANRRIGTETRSHAIDGMFSPCIQARGMSRRRPIAYNVIRASTARGRPGTARAQHRRIRS